MTPSLPAPAAPLARRRDEFPSLARGIHLLSHSLGPMPLGAARAMQEYLERWQEHLGEDAWAAGWWELSSQVGDRLARIIGGAAGTVQVQPSTTVALAAAASCFDFDHDRRRKVITSALDFPSTGYVWMEQRRLGAEIVVVPAEDGIITPPERILDAIDASTCLVALSHTSFLSSHRLDPRPIIETAHRHGARVLLDVYQSAGCVELEAAAWEVDFLIGGSIKWLCGGPACGYLYVRPDLLPALRPRLTGWTAHAEPFAFAPGAIRYAGTTRRFSQGTPAIPALYSCLPGLQLVEEIGVAAIAADSRRRTAWMVDVVRDRGWRLNSPPEAGRRGGSVMIGVDRPEEMVARLARRGVYVDWRPGAGLRLSPHFFNTDEEVREAMEILADLMK